MDVYRASLTVNGHTTHRLVVSRYIVESSAYLPPTVVSSVFFDPKFSHPNRSAGQIWVNFRERKIRIGANGSK